jgi:hypothetical protein
VGDLNTSPAVGTARPQAPLPVGRPHGNELTNTDFSSTWQTPAGISHPPSATCLHAHGDCPLAGPHVPEEGPVRPRSAVLQGLRTASKLECASFRTGIPEFCGARMHGRLRARLARKNIHDSTSVPSYLRSHLKIPRGNMREPGLGNCQACPNGTS